MRLFTIHEWWWLVAVREEEREDFRRTIPTPEERPRSTTDRYDIGKSDSGQMTGSSKAQREHALYAHAGCLSDLSERSDRRCAWKRKSPWNADVRLYIGASWFSSPVPKGEPWVGSLG